VLKIGPDPQRMSAGNEVERVLNLVSILAAIDATEIAGAGRSGSRDASAIRVGIADHVARVVNINDYYRFVAGVASAARQTRKTETARC
jgi:hypothetical protein